MLTVIKNEKVAHQNFFWKASDLFNFQQMLICSKKLSLSWHLGWTF